MKEYQIFIAKTGTDKAQTKLVGYNLKEIVIPVGEATWVPSEYYDKVLSKGSLKERVSVLGVREVEK